MSVGTALAINVEKEGQQLPFYLMNIPRNQWPDQCPEFLINSSERDKRIMSVPNDQYQRATWEEVQEYIRSLDLSHKDLVNVADPFHLKGLIALTASLAFPQICDGIENTSIN